VAKFAGGLYAYIDHKMYSGKLEAGNRIEEFTSIKTFGLQAEALIGRELLVRRASESQAQGPDGEPRHWQGTTSPFLIEIHSTLIGHVQEYLQYEYASLAYTTPDTEYELPNKLMAYFSRQNAVYEVYNVQGTILFTFPAHFTKEVASHLANIWHMAFNQGQLQGEENHKERIRVVLKEMLGV
jgi:hypothetical protein